jgi:hypothetical protein
MEEDDGRELNAMFESPEAKRRFVCDIVVTGKGVPNLKSTFCKLL